MSRSKPIGIALIGLTLLLTGASPYKIIRPKIHELMTIASKRCLDSNELGPKPERCVFDLVDEGRTDRRWTANIQEATTMRYPDLVKAVRWSDDPTQQIGLKSGLKFWVKFEPIKVCARLARQKPDSLNNINDGLTCNTHYGSMQFFHAQASVAGEPASVTHLKIMQWAGFLYDVASAAIPDDSLDVEYCSYFNGDGAFSKAMLPDSTKVPCRNTNREAWALTTLFTMKCRGAFSSSRCPDEESNDRFGLSRIYATGAILHLIQDSYSQAHCLRGECVESDGEILSVVQCAPISMFTTYLKQDSKRHGAADQRPLADAACATNSQIDDPVTAGAKALWHIQNRSPKEEFLRDLERVFGTAEQAAELPVAGPGDCFIERGRADTVSPQS